MSLVAPSLVVSKEGVKDDKGKDRWDLLPWDAVDVLVKVYTMGAAKYADRNWEKGMSWSRILGAMLRHMRDRVIKGEYLDKESGLPHFAHMAWCAITLLTYDMRKVGTDDITTIPYAKETPPTTGGAPADPTPAGDVRDMLKVPIPRSPLHGSGLCLPFLSPYS